MPKSKSRGNGQGTAYKVGSTWTAEVVVGWLLTDDPSKPKKKVRRKKGGFATKREALAYCPQLLLNVETRVRKTMQQVYQEWERFYSPRVGASTMMNYKNAYAYFKPFHGVYMDMISSDNLQTCMDACKAGKRTHQNMRTIAGLLWKYAIDKNIIDRNVTANLYTGKGKSIQREPITPEEESVIRAAIGKERYAEYIYCLCNLGFRPGEFLELRKDMLFCAPVTLESGETVDVWYFINGKKTDAGKDRVVAISPEILPIILDRLFVPGTDYMFPQYVFAHGKDVLKSMKKMSDAYFSTSVFKPMMQRLGIAEGKVPYSGRHSFADKLKRAPGADRDKAALIGHSNYLFTQDKYQSTHLKDLMEIVSGMNP